MGCRDQAGRFADVEWEQESCSFLKKRTKRLLSDAVADHAGGTNT
jgi:hypothetical protein